MDQKTDDIDLARNSCVPVCFRVMKCNLPGREDLYSAKVFRRDTLTVEDLIARIAERGTELRPATLRAAFNLIKNEIYEAIDGGYNVDFDFGRVDVGFAGTFDLPSDHFDADLHRFEPRMNASPRMKQHVARLRGVNDTGSAVQRGLRIDYVVAVYHPAPYGLDDNPNVIPAGFEGVLAVIGNGIRIEGGDPANGISFHCPATGETHAVPPERINLNMASHLIVHPGFALTEGEWVLTLTTQYSSNRHINKKPRRAVLRFRVEAPGGQ